MKDVNTLYITNLGLMDNLAKTQVLPYLEGLARKGLNVNILSFEKKHNLENRELVEKLEKKLSGEGIRWRRLLHHRQWGNAIDLFMGFITAWRIVKKNRISIIHARADIPVLISWPLAKILRLKLIYDRRGTMKGYFVDGMNKKNLFSINVFSNMLDILDRFIVRYSNAVIVLSEKARKKLKEDKYANTGKNIFEVIPCCTDSARFRQRPAERRVNNIDLNGKFVMAYLGSLGTVYLLDEMARFYKTLKKRKENAFFLIISHIDKKYIEGILEKEGLSPGHDYTIINVAPEEVPAYLGMSDCSIMLIKPLVCKIGSSPTKFGESLASGIPVIVNRGIGDTEEIILSQKTGVLVDRFDEPSYEKAVSDLISLLNEKDLKERCVKTAENLFSLSMGIERYGKVYERLTASHLGQKSLMFQ